MRTLSCFSFERFIFISRLHFLEQLVRVGNNSELADMRIEVFTILVRLVFVDSPILEALFLLVEGFFDELGLLELNLCLILVIFGESLKE